MVTTPKNTKVTVSKTKKLSLPNSPIKNRRNMKNRKENDDTGTETTVLASNSKLSSKTTQAKVQDANDNNYCIKQENNEK